MSLKKVNKIISESKLILAEDNLLFESFTIGGECDDILGVGNPPRIINAAGLCICLEGEAEVIINAQSYRLRKGDLCVIFPYSILQINYKSKDFSGYTLATTTEFFTNVNIPSSTTYYLFIKENPCISLNTEEQQQLLSLCDDLKERDLRRNHPFRYEISNLSMLTIFYEIIAIYQQGKPIPKQSFSRKNRLFLEFQQLITIHFHEYKNVDFYADKLCITPRYLSEISKEVAGITATKCIDRMIIINARVLLTTTEMTIQQISDELNFPNPSFFSKFFKKHVGLTPREYRENSRN